MSDELIPPGITPEDWQTTPRAVREWGQALVHQLEQLEQRIAQLEERLHQNSHNSSLPPSSDPPSVPPRPARPASGRPRGGQPGHPGHGRRLQPLAHVQRVHHLRPTQCAGCGALLLGEDAHPQRHQVTELPRLEPVVTEYRLHTLTCLACGAATPAHWPADMPAGDFGPGVQATTAYLAGRMGMSDREITETLATLGHLEVGLGSVSGQQARVSAALEPPVAAARTYVQQQAAVHLDETGWREQSQHAWLWVCATPGVAAFWVRATRKAKDAQELLGTPWAGIVSSDRWTAYNWLDPHHRQLCWAHLQRDFQKVAERRGESARVGEALLAQAHDLFRLWGGVRAGTLSRRDFQVKVQPIQACVQALLREGTTLAQIQTRHTCQNILKLESALWTFVEVPGVEPTNNHAERCLRRAVLWRRRSFGTQSARGSRFVERVLTAVTTLRLQKRDVLDYLTAACAAAIRGDNAPSLLPQTST